MCSLSVVVCPCWPESSQPQRHKQDKSSAAFPKLFLFPEWPWLQFGSGSVTVLVWNCLSGSGFRFQRFVWERGVSSGNPKQVHSKRVVFDKRLASV